MVKKKKKTIGNANPLHDYLIGGAKKTHAKSSSRSAEPTVAQPRLATQDVKVPKKQRVTMHISIDLIERVKNAVYWEPGLTLTEFAQTAFEKQLKKMEAGETYPQRKHRRLKGGRPLK